MGHRPSGLQCTAHNDGGDSRANGLNDGVERHELRLRVVNQPGTLHFISAIVSTRGLSIDAIQIPPAALDSGTMDITLRFQAEPARRIAIVRMLSRLECVIAIA